MNHYLEIILSDELCTKSLFYIWNEKKEHFCTFVYTFEHITWKWHPCKKKHMLLSSMYNVNP